MIMEDETDNTIEEENYKILSFVTTIIKFKVRFLLKEISDVWNNFC